MLTRDKIIKTANKDWAEFYQCEASLFSKPGSRMVISERMKGMARFIEQQRQCGSGRVPPSPNCPRLRFGQLRIAETLCAIKTRDSNSQ